MPKAAIDSVMPIATHLPAMDAAAAVASRLLHDVRMAASWRALGPVTDPALAASSGPAGARSYLLRMECDAGPLAMFIAPSDDAVLSMACAPDLGEPLRALAVEALFGETVRLGARALPGLRPVALTAALPGQVPRNGWCAIRGRRGELGRLAVQQLPAPVHDALRGVAQHGSRRGSGRLPALRVAGTASIACTAMSLALLRSLALGDVVLLPAALTALEGARATVRFGARGGCRLSARARIEHGSLLVEGEIEMIDDEQEPAGLGVEPAALGELDLPVRFEIETVSVPLADLEAIEPGYVIELAMPAADARLRLVSCGQVIGHADLVAVGSRLGARITRMVARDDADQHG